MAESWDEEQLIAEGFERAYVELEWYDGPRAGLADVGGVPHYIRSYDFDHADEADEYQVWPASGDAVEMEREQWEIFVRWNQRRDAGAAGPDGHPATGGVDARYDELNRLLTAHREMPSRRSSSRR
nr:hypothetical protein GCM10020092_022900 [Actinoplanes digitatis]